MTIWFTSDEHLGHKNIIKYAQRPFRSVDEMDEVIINNFNSVVNKDDFTVHAGDFCLIKDSRIVYEKYINKLNGKHLFLKGSHDYFIPWKNSQQIWERNIHVNGERYYFVVCHYAMLKWARSHYGSIHLFGHSHGKLILDGKRHDCGVDANNFYPMSDLQVIEMMDDKEIDDLNRIKHHHNSKKQPLQF